MVTKMRTPTIVGGKLEFPVGCGEAVAVAVAVGVDVVVVDEVFVGGGVVEAAGVAIADVGITCIITVDVLVPSESFTVKVTV
jgi:pyrimidine operon attenuation protein/uracil phosphoribosyltransferase